MQVVSPRPLVPADPVPEQQRAGAFARGFGLGRFSLGVMSVHVAMFGACDSTRFHLLWSRLERHA